MDEENKFKVTVETKDETMYKAPMNEDRFDSEEVSNFNTPGGNNGLGADNSQPQKKGRKIDPETLRKYMQIKVVLAERPNEFSRAELCKKHSINYHNFSQWISKQSPKERAPEPRYKPVTNPLVGQSIILTTLDDLMHHLTPLLRDAIKTAVLEGEKQGKISIRR
jgi:hypothetical protein